MSVQIPNLSRASSVGAVLAAASAVDLVGLMEDGSVGVFALRGLGPDGGAGVAERFLPRLQTILRGAFAPGFGISLRIWFRAVHRWAVEVAEPDELVEALYASPAQVVGIGLTSVPSRLVVPRAPVSRSAEWR
jgi:hypothetical protein